MLTVQGHKRLWGLNTDSVSSSFNSRRRHLSIGFQNTYHRRSIAPTLRSAALRASRLLLRRHNLEVVNSSAPFDTGAPVERVGATSLAVWSGCNASLPSS